MKETYEKVAMTNDLERKKERKITDKNDESRI